MHLGMSGSFRVDARWRCAVDARIGSQRRRRPSRSCGFPDVVGRHRHVQRSAAIWLHGSGAAGAARESSRSRALGPEPLSAAFDASALARACKGKKTSLKVTLLDQRVVAGLGNIYVSEALHLAGCRRTGAPRRLPPRPACRARRRIVWPPRSSRFSSKPSSASRRPAYRSSRFRVYDREGRAMPKRGCGGMHRAPNAGRPVDVLLPGLPAVAVRV